MKLGALLLVSGGAFACACATFKVDFSQVATDLAQVVGIDRHHTNRQHPHEIIVSAGNQLTISAGVQIVTPLGADEVGKRLGWAGMYEKGGWLSFRGQSLEIVVAEINRYNARKLRIADPRTAHIQVGGKFKVNDLEAFVAALAMTNDVRATLSGSARQFGDEIILSGGDTSGSAAIGGEPERGAAQR